jgi:hypothetical protein
MVTGRKTKSDAIGAFFADISTRGQIPILGSAEGTIRFDVSDTKSVERWYVTMSRGEVTVSHKSTKAVSVIHADRALLNEIVEGRRNAMAAVLRGALVVEGDLKPLILFTRLFPGQRGSKGRVAPITEVSQSR